MTGIRGVKVTRIVMAIAALCAGMIAAAAAEWKFEVENKSSAAVMEFRTQEDGEWSQNWIRDRIEPGDTFNMDFGHDDGECAVRTQINFTDGSSFDNEVDYCEASKLTVFDDRVEWE